MIGNWKRFLFLKFVFLSNPSNIFHFSKGYFIQPTIVETKDPLDKIMTEEIFGPLLTIYVYKDSEIDKTVDLVISSTPYALTGAVFAQDK